MNIKKNWWKVLSVILMMYTLFVGFLAPIKPGVLELSHDSDRRAKLGQKISLTAKTYNTFLTSYESKAFLLLPDDRLLNADRLDIKSDVEATVYFSIPSTLEFGDREILHTNLIINQDKSGYVHYSDAVIIENEVADSTISGTFTQLSNLTAHSGFAFPFRPLLYETIRNQFFHVAIWMAMFALLIVSCYHSIVYLIKKNLDNDSRSAALTTSALVLGVAGILTGSMWAKYTWGAFWTDDVKLNMTAISLLIYFSYWVLRASISDVDARARLSAVFNIFAFITLMILVMVIPRLSEDSLHPGNGGNPAFGSEDLDNTLRAVFYPAIIAYFLIGVWIAQLIYRYENLSEKWSLRRD